MGTGAGTFEDNTFTFKDSVFYALLGNPTALVAGAFDGDQNLDLAIATLNYPGVDLTVPEERRRLLANSMPTKGGTYSLKASDIKTLVTGDFNGDGRLDLAAANYLSSDDYSFAQSLTVILGIGNGQFQEQPMVPLSNPVRGLVAGDFNGDGRLDLAATDFTAGQVIPLLGTGTGDFVPPVLAPNPVKSTPLVAQLTGPQPDALVLNQQGQILFRRGLADQPGAFAPPVVLNPDPQKAARALALVRSAGSSSLVAALDVKRLAVTLYQPHADGTFTTLSDLLLPPGFLPAEIAAADLTGDGLGDLGDQRCCFR